MQHANGCIGHYDKAFDLAVQRHPIRQSVLDLEEDSDSQPHCAEDSENRIKELKLDSGGDTLPCSGFNTNALYFRITALSYNLFALSRSPMINIARHRLKK